MSMCRPTCRVWYNTGMYRPTCRVWGRSSALGCCEACRLLRGNRATRGSSAQTLNMREKARVAPHAKGGSNRAVLNLLVATHEQERASLFRDERTLFASILSRPRCHKDSTDLRSPSLCRGEGPARDTPSTEALKQTPSG